jgi:hypothetical protein
MPPSSYKKEKLILKIYIRLLLYIKEKYNEILNPTALLLHLTNEINLINQDRALDKTFYDLFTTASQRELKTASQRELKTAPKIETQEDVKRRMSEYMEKLIDTMKSMKAMKKEVYIAGDDSENYLDSLEFPENLNDLTTLLQILGERNEHMRTIYNHTNTTQDIDNTIRIIMLLSARVELKILNARKEEDKRKLPEIQAQRQAKIQAERALDNDDDDE